MRIDTKIDKIIESLKEKDFLSDSVFTENLEIIRHNLEVIESAKIQIKNDSKANNVGYGFLFYRKLIIAHPGIKMIEASEKIILSCFRQLNIKPQIPKKEIMTPLMKLQQKMNG